VGITVRSECLVVSLAPPACDSWMTGREAWFGEVLVLLALLRRTDGMDGCARAYHLRMGGCRRRTCVRARRWGVEAKDASGRRMQPIAERELSGAAAAVRSVEGCTHARPVVADTCAPS